MILGNPVVNAGHGRRLVGILLLAVATTVLHPLDPLRIEALNVPVVLVVASNAFSRHGENQAN